MADRSHVMRVASDMRFPHVICSPIHGRTKVVVLPSFFSPLAIARPCIFHALVLSITEQRENSIGIGLRLTAGRR